MFKIIELARTLIFRGFENLRCHNSFRRVPRWPTKKINIAKNSINTHLDRIFGPKRFGHAIEVNEPVSGAVRIALFKGISLISFITTISSILRSGK